MKWKCTIGILNILFCLNIFPFDEVKYLDELNNREVHFDFCGLDSLIPVNDCNNRMSSGYRLLFRDMELRRPFFREKFLSAVERMEHTFLKGNSSGISNSIFMVSSMLKTIRDGAKTNFMDKVQFITCLERVEYSLARIVNNKSTSLNPQNVAQILPDIFFNPISVADSEEFRRLRVFKNLIKVGCSINEFRKDLGCIPSSLNQLSDLPVNISQDKGMSIKYETNGRVWQLYCAGNVDNLMFDVYVPLLRGMPAYKWRHRGVVWFSSTFSDKRKRLYKGKMLNEGTPWECVMRDGKVISSDLETK